MKLRPLYIILLFLLLFFYWVSAEADVTLEVGPTNLSGDWAGGAAILSERFGKYELGIGYISEQEVSLRTFSLSDPSCTRITDGYNRCDFEIRENIFVHAQRIVKYKKCELGIGPAYFSNTSRVFGSHFNIGLMAGCYINKNLSIRIRHYSNAGSATPNLGQDILTIGYKF
jgi:hypothetical protein